MNKRIFRVALLLLVATMLLSSCGKPPKMEVENGQYTNKKSGVTYLRAPMNYEATSIVKGKTVARVAQDKLADIVLYEIESTAPEKLLATEDYELFYAKGTTLPTLWEMNPTKVLLSQTGTISFATGVIEETADVASLVNLYRSGVSFSKDEIDVALTPTRYDLKFSSVEHPAFYYTLTYWRFTKDVEVWELVDDPNAFVPTYEGIEVTVQDYEGENYAVYNFGKEILYDRTTGKCYAVGDTVAKYLDDTDSAS